MSVSLLAVFPAPTTFLWMLAIGVTEWGHVLALLSILPLFPGWRRTRKNRLALIFSLGAATLALTPLMRGCILSRDLPAKLHQTFGEVRPLSLPNAASRPGPLVLTDIVRGLDKWKVQPERFDYVVRDGTPLSLDFYSPAARNDNPSAPCVIVIHGGSWRSGDSAQLAPLNEYLAARGYAVAAINYRLGKQHPFPAASDDVLSALSYLKANASQLGIDAQRFVLLGRSAGAQLALLVAYRSQDQTVKGVISFYGPADLRYSYAHPGNPFVIDTRGVLDAYLGGNPVQLPEQYDTASPINFADSNSPPTLLIHGGRDELVSHAQSERLAARLQQAGNKHFLLTLPWATHACDFNLSGPCGQISTYAVERFLAAVL